MEAPFIHSITLRRWIDIVSVGLLMFLISYLFSGNIYMSERIGIRNVIVSIVLSVVARGIAEVVKRKQEQQGDLARIEELGGSDTGCG